ncbi:Unknown protein [Striga hermonthica]|uniref:Late embryogenesis abundant protein LEA-2 subgroup domain-containing protein n=1 Tax=Striga hermonthica TaxID=68872 RepID=A0A9N7RQS5_STRHE|nr:Unknown protein [Striga hermonthica]
MLGAWLVGPKDSVGARGSPPPSTPVYACGPHQGYPPSYNVNYPNYPIAYSPHHKYDPTLQNPYHPYPNTGDFYYPQQHYKTLVPDGGDSSSSFGRLMLILMAVLVTAMCMMTLVMWFLFGTYIPEFNVASLKVSNFTVSNVTLTGTWDVGVSVANTNKDLAISFDRVMSSIFYKEALLGISAVRPFQVGQMQHTEFNFSMPAEQNMEENKLQGWVLPTLEQDHGNGMVVFSLRLALKANFTTQNMVYRQENMRVMCENMQLIFSAATGNGTLSPGMRTNCLIRVNEGLKDY